jgi:SAM-dependent methyltransferase
LDRHRPAANDAAAVAAFREGRRRWALIYANAAWSRAPAPGAKRAMARRAPLASAVAMTAAGLRKLLPPRLYGKVRDMAKPRAIGRGGVDMGDFARNRPVGSNFGLDRGTPIDRWYIERFLAAHAADIRGRVLEVGDASYSRRFGSGVTRQDVFDRPGGPVATLTGDLTVPGTLPEAAFDCLVITQVLQLLYDMPAAIGELHRSLAPGGVLLLTVPGVTAIDPAEWDGAWYWSLTGQSAERLLGAAFGPDHVRISVHGNVYGATCFLQGLAVEEIDTALLADDDPAYPMLVCVRAQRAE